MKLVIKKSHGSVTVDINEIEILIQEQLQMVPGIYELADNGIINKMILMLNSKSYKSVNVYPLGVNKIGIECHIKVVDGINFKEIASEAQKIIKFSVEKKYGLNVDCIDIIIDGFVRR